MSAVLMNVISSLDSISIEQFATIGNGSKHEMHCVVCSLECLRPTRRRRTASAAMTVMDNVFDDDPNALVKRIRQLDEERQEQRKQQIAECERRGIQLLSANQRHRFDPTAVLKLNRHIRYVKPDVIRTWDDMSYRWTKLAASRPGLPLVERCERVTSASKNNRTADTAHRDGTHDGNARRDDRNEQRLTRKQFLQSLHLPADARLIGAIGPLTTSARIKDLIWAAELLRVVNDETHLLIAGEGPEEWRLHRFRDQVRIRHRVRFLGRQPEYQRWLQHLDFFWAGNKADADPAYIVEAMSVGLPVVASDIDVYREVITSEENGFLVRPCDRAAFAKHTWRLINDDAEYTRIGHAARESVAVDCSELDVTTNAPGRCPE